MPRLLIGTAIRAPFPVCDWYCEDSGRSGSAASNSVTAVRTFVYPLREDFSVGQRRRGDFRIWIGPGTRMKSQLPCRSETGRRIPLSRTFPEATTTDGPAWAQRDGDETNRLQSGLNRKAGKGGKRPNPSLPRATVRCRASRMRFLIRVHLCPSVVQLHCSVPEKHRTRSGQLAGMACTAGGCVPRNT